MMDERIPSREELIEDLEYVKEQYLIETGSFEKLPRKYYREHGTYPDKFFEAEFGNWTNFRNSIDFEVRVYKKRDFQDIRKKHCEPGKYFITTLPIGGEVDRNFFETIKHYCMINNAELLIMVSDGVLASHYMTEDIYEEFYEYFVSRVYFNSNLIARNMGLKPKQVSKLDRFYRVGQKVYSLIIPSVKQMYKTVPQIQGKFPHVMASTGSMAHLEYPEDSTGVLAEQDHVMGGLIIEIEDDTYFHIRQVQCNESGGFYDLNTYYYLNTTERSRVEAIASEPHFGAEDWTSLQGTLDIIHYTGCKRLFLHDMYDLRSINHHEGKKILDRMERPNHQKFLKTELRYIGKQLSKFVRECPEDLEIFVVESNHDYFLYKWLNESLFSRDEHNIELAIELFHYHNQSKHPIETYLKKHFPLLEKLNFLGLEGYNINGVEWGLHGHQGTNGGRGSIPSVEKYCGFATRAHSHMPEIMRGIFNIGCDCLLKQHYNKGGGSSWLPANVIQHPDGSRQLIVKIDGKWRLIDEEM